MPWRARAPMPAGTPTDGRVIATRCTSDPDATLATSSRHRRSEPAYKQHTAVDGACGVVLDIEVTTGAVHDTQPVARQLAAIATTTGAVPAIATMDAGYATTRVFAALEAAGIEAIVPTRAAPPPRRGTIPVRRFKLDAQAGVVRCPAGRTLRPHGKPDDEGFQAYRARVADCDARPLRPHCFAPTMRRRAVLLHKDHPAMLRARRKHGRWSERERRLYASHRARAEAVHGEAKTWHGPSAAASPT